MTDLINPLEQDILPAVLVDITALPDTIAWRANSGLLRSPDGKRRIRANIPGCGDVIGCRKSKGFAIETKTLTGTQRKTQENFEKRWVAAGGIYIVARSASEAVSKLTAAIP